MPHHWQMGLSLSSWARRRLYVGSEYAGLVIDYRASLGLARRVRALLSVWCSWP